MDHSTKQTIADVAFKTIGFVGGLFVTLLGGKQAYKKIKEKKGK
jgi:hypothetical protein